MKTESIRLILLNHLKSENIKFTCEMSARHNTPISSTVFAKPQSYRILMETMKRKKSPSNSY
jgi:hypothetical protein